MMSDHYQFFTDRAREVMRRADQEAQRFNHEYIGTEHILLGLLNEGSGVAANVLVNFDVDLATIRLEVEKIVQTGPDIVIMGQRPQTPRARQVIKYSIKEALKLGHRFVGTEHLLLGFLRDRKGVAGQVLMALGLKLEDVRRLLRAAECLMKLGVKRDLAPEKAHRLLYYERTPPPGLPRWSGRRSPPSDPELHRAIPEACNLPEEDARILEGLEAQLNQLGREKEEAVKAMEFEQAAVLRDRANELKHQREILIKDRCLWHIVDVDWLSWNGGTVRRLARAIAETGRWQTLPRLADALELAGCTDPELLDHCRNPGEHGSRCWVVDILLARE